jgi:hypothetical protein
MMRWIRAALAVAVVGAVVLLGGAPAWAGNWAVTTLDPLPDRIEPGRAYTVGFWVLQHGSHPYSGDLDPVGLKLVERGGQVVTYPGRPLPEPAHYAAAVLIPRAGTWTILALQGPFADYRVGTATVPGAVVQSPVPPPLPAGADGDPWGAIRPPAVPVDPGRDPFNDPAVAIQASPIQNGAAQVAAPAVKRAAAPRNGGVPLPAALVAALAAAVAGAMLPGLRRRVGPRLAAAVAAGRRRRPREPGPRRELIR